MSSMLIKRARIVNPRKNEDFTGDIFIEGEKVAVIGEDLFDYISKADQVIDADGLIAAPGLVDMHVHLRDPGQTEKEDIHSGCRAAAAGGVTSMLCMPNTFPTVDHKEMVQYILDKAKTADANVYVAASITKGLEGGEATDLDDLAAGGATAFSDDGRPVIDTRILLDALKKAREKNYLITAHCEDLYIADGGLMNEGETSERMKLPGINRAAEDCGTAREIAAAAAVGAPIHICHVSTKGSVELIRDAKKRGIKVTAETAPHYLLLTDELLENRDADYKMNPPLRTEEDRLALIEALRDGTIDAIATDHAPHTPAEKSSFLRAPNGIIGMETSLSATLTALDGILGLSDVIRLMSCRPAQIMGVPGGEIAVGANADIVLFDAEEHYTVDAARLHGKSKNTPFKGMQLKGKVKYTLFRGRKVYEDS